MVSKDNITVFAKTNFRNKEVPFGIKTDDRRRHMYLIGKTGMGKTTMMENMAIQDIRNGHGLAFLDPHGDSIQRILNCVPASRVNDVVYFNPADLDFPIAFNILEAVDSRYKHLVASGLMGVFTKIWSNVWSARMEYILNNTVLALLESPGNTLLGITRMYVDKKYRKKIVDNIKDPVVRTFWTDEFANYNEKYRTEAIAPIQNKVGQFLSSGIIRNIVGQPKSTIDLREIMDNRKILIMDLSKGRVGEDNSALLGAMIVTKLQLAAMSRTDIPEGERQDFYLYVDEFQNFATESFATILSEARKYRLNLIVGHQYIAQLEQEKSTKVRDAIFGNVGSIVLFRIGAADAEFLETEFDPIFTPNDMVNLPKYNIILKLMINGVASEPFSAVTVPASPDYFTGNGEKVIKVSRERYANSINIVEEKIARWMGADFHEGTARLAGLGADETEDVKDVQPIPEKSQYENRAQPNLASPPANTNKDFSSLEQFRSAKNSEDKIFTDFKKEEPKNFSGADKNIHESRPAKTWQKHKQPKSGINQKPAEKHKFNKARNNPIWDAVSKLQEEKKRSQTLDVNSSQDPTKQTENADRFYSSMAEKNLNVAKAEPLHNIQNLKAQPPTASTQPTIASAPSETHKNIPKQTVLKPGHSHKF